MLEQSLRAQLQKNHAEPVSIFTESLDVGHFPTDRDAHVFRDYIAGKYAGRTLSLVVLFLGGDFVLVQEIPPVLATNVPLVYVSINNLPIPSPPSGHPSTSVFQRFDVQGTVRFISQLQPDLRRLVVIAGTAPADQAVLDLIEASRPSLKRVTFEYWTNRPAEDISRDVKTLPRGTAILLGSFHRDATGQFRYGSETARLLAPAANAPLYVLGAGLVGSGAVGGQVVDFSAVGSAVGTVAARVLSGIPADQVPPITLSTSVPMVDWNALHRWHIAPFLLPAHCLILNPPYAVWRAHWRLALFIGSGFVAQAVTIAAMFFQRRRQRHAEAEILRQRTELTHVARVSMMGQMVSALTHELNQPLGAILRNAEAAEVYLQNEPPNLEEIRAILTDIRRDDKRAGNVIDRMRSLFKRQKLALSSLDLRDLVEDTMAMTRPDAAARHVRLKVELPPQLPAAQGDRVHIQQVLLNLIFNGMDAMAQIPKGRRLLTVRVAETKAGNLRLSVNDHGSGVPPDNARFIFEPFFSTKSNGMGMGLAISKTIIEAHGGEIWMHSSAMDGTTFTVVLPPAGAERVKLGDLPASL